MGDHKRKSTKAFPYATKDELEEALRDHQAAKNDEMKSEQREAAADSHFRL
jgi:hypothetical protein